MNDPKLTINGHEEIRREMLSGLVPERDFDDIDHECAELAADPLTERYAKPRSEKQTNRVLSILDELERSGHE